MVQTSLAGSPAKRLILRASALALLVITALLFLYFRTGRAAIGVEESIVKVERKNFTQSLRLNGTTKEREACVVPLSRRDCVKFFLSTLTMDSSTPMAARPVRKYENSRSEERRVGKECRSR